MIRKDITNFNSIKVRLEHYAECGIDSRNLNFNSIKVRLELIAKKTYSGAFPHFNSIKVRLEHWICGQMQELATISIP